MRIVLLTLAFLGLALSGVPSIGTSSTGDDCCGEPESCCMVQEDSCCEVETPTVSIAPGCPCGDHGPGDALGCSFELVLLAPHDMEERFWPEDPTWGTPRMERVEGRETSPETPPPRMLAS